MSFPSHLILDFSTNANKKTLISYWALNYSYFKNQNPIFIDEINVNGLVSNTGVSSWVQFLKVSGNTFLEHGQSSNLTQLSTKLYPNPVNTSSY